MKELRPILADDPTKAERWLFESARLDVAPPDAKARLLAALAQPGGAGAGPSGPRLGSPPATAGGPGSVSVAAMVAKWLALGALAGTVFVSAVARVSPGFDATPASRIAAATPLPTERSEPLPASSPGALGGESVRIADDEGAARAENAAPTREREAFGAAPPAASQARSRTGQRASEPTVGDDTPAAPPSDPQHALAAEVRSLEAIRSAAARGDQLAALHALDSHTAEFRRPRLAQEAALLRVEILVALKRLDEARGVGAALLRDDPSSAHAQRLRSLIGAQ